jgi:hypothetical protein
LLFLGRSGNDEALERIASLMVLGLVADDLAHTPKISAEKAALASWLRQRTSVSLRWLSARLQMGHDTNAGGGTRKMKSAALRRCRQARAKLQLLDALKEAK